METNEKYKEIIVLSELLDKANIPYTMEPLLSGWNIYYPNKKDTVLSAIEHILSYGEERDTIEIQGLLSKEEMDKGFFASYLTANEVFTRIKNHYEGNSDKKW